MNVTGCFPLAGQGLVARRGSLIALTDGMDPGPDALLGALAAVADANGDGGALVLAGTRAALERGGRPAWACAGVTFAGEVVVLVHGEAVAVVCADGGPEAEVTDNGSMVPVVRTFTGAAVTVRLAIGAPAAPDPRLWLGAGTVYGGGVILTVADEASQAFVPRDPQPSAASSPLPELEPVAEEEETVLRHGGPAHASLVFQDPVTEVLRPVDAADQLGYEPTMLAAPAARDVPSPSEAVPAGAVPAGVYPAGGALGLGYEPTMLAEAGQSLADPPADGLGWPGEQAAFPDDPFASTAGPAEPAQAAPDSESWFRTDAQQVSGPTLRTTQTDPAGAGAMPEPPIADLSTMELVPFGAVEPVLVDGAMCARMHFNAPEAVFCRECGLSMPGDSRNMRRQPRPPLGVLLVDDGRGFTLDRDYVIGREPVLDIDVAAGRAAPLRISDDKGSVSRLHLRVSLIGWRVEVCDLGSSNGSVLYRQGAPSTLAPLDAAVLDPGARVGVGRRTVQFLPYGVSAFGPTPDGAT
ncbi:MAG: hypothetical protein JWM19_1609 [Actinomycetia bacterium]|nr:hypothetical protein [Actinomycetes bacterium]